MAGRPPGGQKFGGRKKGSVNKVTGALKEAILRAANEAGGGGEEGTLAYLTDLAVNQPQLFVPLLGKVLPMTINGDDQGGPVQITFKTVYEEKPGGLG